jgi:hypothetical protein
MKNPKKMSALVVILIFFSLFCTDSVAETNAWEKLDEGLFLGKFDPKKKSRVCKSKIIILKIDPKLYSFKLLSASEHGRKPRTARQWGNEFGLVGAINASMYQNVDFLKSTGYMKNYRHFNNSHINKKFSSFLVFNPIDSSLPGVQIIDRRVQKNWKSLMKKYHTVVQNYRMISKGKKRGWPQREVLYSTAAIGVDRENDVLFVLSPSPYSVHDFILILLSLPINIKNAMYVEGGPEASVYLKIDDKEMKWAGSCQTDFTEQDDPEKGYKLPNIVGVVKQR